MYLSSYIPDYRWLFSHNVFWLHKMNHRPPTSARTPSTDSGYTCRGVDDGALFMFTKRFNGYLLVQLLGCPGFTLSQTYCTHQGETPFEIWKVEKHLKLLASWPVFYKSEIGCSSCGTWCDVKGHSLAKRCSFQRGKQLEKENTLHSSSWLSSCSVSTQSARLVCDIVSKVA